MSIEIKVPVLPESVTDATIATWYKQPGEAVSADENLVDIETDKVVLEVPAPSDGILKKIIHAEGDTVGAETVIAVLEEGAAPSAEPAPAPDSKVESDAASSSAETSDALSPAVRRLVSEHALDATKIPGTGKGGRITAEDVEKFMKQGPKVSAEQTPVVASGPRSEERVPMSRLRARVAERLVQAQHEAAMLTTFNEVDLYEVMALRKKYKDVFEETHDVRLGFMSFFTKACVEALKRFPAVNASIDGNDIIYHGYYDVGIAVSSERGLVVPVVRDAEQKGLAELEKDIKGYAKKARDGKLTLDELTGGTFTITNGGVFGSMLSTPIINPPQVGILGMHAIKERPVVVNGEIQIRPMMYLALSYDHRIVDGQQSVGFLVAVKELLEDPSRLLLEI